MPRATSDKLLRAHQSSAKKSNTAGAGRVTNPIFKTERYGQHILTNHTTAQKIVDTACILPSERVLEVGPGTGNLTIRILEKAKHVIAVEMDPRMAAEVLKRVQGTPDQRKLQVIIGDFIKSDIPPFAVFISNTPYQISSPLIFRLLSHRPLFRIAILMFQREFALRLIAQPSTALWSRLSANVQLYAKVDLVMHVPKHDFKPPPMVESAVVRLVPLDPPPPVVFGEFDGLNRIIFSRANKTVRGNFQAKGVLKMVMHNQSAWLAANEKMIDDDSDVKVLIDEVLQETGYAECRAAKMGINDILKLLCAFHDANIHFS